MRDIKVGIIGCGGIAYGKHLPAIANMGNVKLVAFCDIVIERAEESKAKYGTKDASVYLSYEDMLKSEDAEMEAVHVCTPNKSHAPITVAALESGRHVICEKPMAKDVAGGKAMVATAKKTGKLLTVGYQNRCRTDSLYLKGVCERGELGEIYYAEALAIRRRAVPTWGVFLNEDEQGGGPLIDIGTHALDLTLWMMDNYEPQMVVGSVYRKLADTENAANAWGPWDPKEFSVEDSAFGFIKFKNGATVLLKSSWAINIIDSIEAKCTLVGDKGGADMLDGLRINGENDGRTFITKPDMEVGGVDFYDGASEKPADVECMTFYSAIINGTPLRVLPEQALVVTELLAAIYESNKTGKPVYFD